MGEALSRDASETQSPEWRSPKAQRTRAALLEAARTVFARDGVIAARVTDITAEAGLSHGSFYTYFDSKSHIFRVLVTDVMDKVWHTRMSTDGQTGLSAYARIERSNRQFVRLYREYADIFGLHEQAASTDPEVRKHRLFVRQRSIDRVRYSVERLQGSGAVRTDVDAGLAAHALVSMVSNFCYFWLVMGEGDFDDDQVVDALTRLWASALRLDES